MRFLPVMVATIMASVPIVAMAECCLPPEHTLFTQGHGDIKVPPDALTFSATTEAVATTVQEAQKKAQTKMIAIIAGLKAQEKTLELTKPLKLQTQNVQVYPVYDEKSKLRKIIGYRSSNSLKVTAMQNTGKLGDAGSKLLEVSTRLGADNAGGLNFFVDDMDTPKLKALAEAVASAKRQADVMAKGLGITLKGVQSAEGTPQYGYQPMYRSEMLMAKSAMADAGAPAPPVETGEVSVTCDISVRYLIAD
jgi:uncharacterized protein